MKPIDHLDKYMAGQLSADERVTFEAAMQQDADLRELVANYDTIKEVSTLALEEELLNEIKRVRQKPQPQAISSTQPVKKTSLLAIAAVLLLAIAAGIYYYSNSFRNTEEVMAYYIPPIDLDNVRSTDISQMSDFNKAKHLLAGLNEYEKSRALFEELLSSNLDEYSDSQVQEMNSWLAHAYFQLNDYYKAEELFRQASLPADSCNLLLCQVLINKIEKDRLFQECKKVD